MNKIILKPREDARLRAGHLWIFSNEIKTIEGTPAAGDRVEVMAPGGEFLGIGFFNPRSLIAVRMLSRARREIDAGFFQEKMAAAAAYRAQAYPGLTAVRMVFGESDGLPGLIIDQYGQCLSLQMLSAGMEVNKQLIIDAARAVFAPQGIIARNDSALRELEGLPQGTEVLWGDVPDRVTIDEWGCRFHVDLRAGQKTGFFLDQKDNKQALARYCSGKRVLDAFCHTGGFGIAMAKAGARDVVWLDSSRPALDLTSANAALNDITIPMDGIVGDAEEYLATVTPGRFDVINIDPPALIKSRKFFPQGYKAYRKLNTQALAALAPGGILATSSCSHHLPPPEFRKMLEEAAAKAGKQVRLLETRTQPKDHPVLLAMPETEYLKFAILQVV